VLAGAIYQAARVVVQRESAVRIGLRVALAQQFRHQRIVRARCVHQEARGVDQMMAQVFDLAVRRAQPRAEQAPGRIVFAAGKARRNAELIRAEQCLQLQGVAHGEGCAAGHP